ncbi:Testican-1 Protein SPOCK [Takifugu flavidus]|uniref:Testican-1 Protein SPOCK n=1 Tax=Takifugu flavidus TaxID=433684 RepID=A0A5C6MK19_9TELE|nr:Testican-1 Protein SPOCK [Takifugu flavidus]
MTLCTIILGIHSPGFDLHRQRLLDVFISRRGRLLGHHWPASMLLQQQEDAEKRKLNLAELDTQEQLTPALPRRQHKMDADRDLNIFLIQPMSSLDSSAGLSVVEQPNTYRMTVFALDFGPDATKDPCLKVRCPAHRVCISHDVQTAICTNRKQPAHSVKPRKGSTGHKHRLEASAHGKCRLCSALQSSPVCGSDGHTYSSKLEETCQEEDKMVSRAFHVDVDVPPGQILGQIRNRVSRKDSFLFSRHIRKMVQERLEEVGGVGLTFLIPQIEHLPDVLNKEGLVMDWCHSPFRGRVESIGAEDDHFLLDRHKGIPQVMKCKHLKWVLAIRLALNNDL